MLLFLKIIKEYTMIEDKPNYEEIYLFKYSLLFLIVSFYVNLILHECQICLNKKGEKTLNI